MSEWEADLYTYCQVLTSNLQEPDSTMSETKAKETATVALISNPDTHMPHSLQTARPQCHWCVKFVQCESVRLEMKYYYCYCKLC